ncbi:MAG TPA: DUF1289 domain-containing protein [Steroidobacteraceae bacterium]
MGVGANSPASQSERSAAGVPILRACDPLPGFSCAGVIKFETSQPVCRSMSDLDASTQSPCIRDCCLGDDLTCLGCFRSLDEIKEWGLADTQRRLVILHNARQRRAEYQSQTAR